MEEGGGLWFSRRALTLHAIIIVIVPTFAALCIWQVHRALDGNSLSWAYVFEWPFFAGYAVYMWWRFVHENPPAAAAKVSAAIGHSASAATDPTLIEHSQAHADAHADAHAGADTAEAVATANASANAGSEAEAEADDPDAADRQAYNRYLAELAAQDKPKTW
jgi:hypothetical protein